MKILALDTATTACSVAAHCDGVTLAHDLQIMGRGQSEALIPMLQDVLTRAGLEVGAFDLIAVTRGPGAFTGLRIGLAAARGLALASGVPCCGISTTEALAEAARDAPSAPRSVLVAIDSKRSDIYVQGFDPAGNAAGAPQAVGVEGLRRHVEALALPGPVDVAGDAAERVLALLPAGYVRSPAPDVPDARCVARVAARALADGSERAPPSPLYLRPADAALPKHGGRLRP